MKPAKLYVSVTREDGSFLVRGMASQNKTRELLQDFAATRPGEHAVFALFSQHDGRLRLRTAEDAFFEAEVIGRAPRNASFFGLLPAMPEIALRSTTFSEKDAEAVIHALYSYGRAQFLHMVKQEIGE